MSPSSPSRAGASLPISCVVITRDAADRLAATLGSAAACGERLVVDSGSTDATVAIARNLGARVEHQPFLGFGPQKRRAVELAAHDWILSLDADEELDTEAVRGLVTLDLSDPERCWAWRRRTFIGGRELRHGPWGHERVLRLFNRTRSGFTAHRVHELAYERHLRLAQHKVVRELEEEEARVVRSLVRVHVRALREDLLGERLSLERDRRGRHRALRRLIREGAALWLHQLEKAARLGERPIDLADS
jgi:glycosyltransferase involved in cell wall biosynthesis